jgi:hypothetical protein
MISGQRETAFHLVRFVRVHLVVKASPSRVRTIQFFIGKLACSRPPPHLGSEVFQYPWPAAVRIFKSVRVQAGKELSQRAISANQAAWNQSGFGPKQRPSSSTITPSG